MRKFIAVLSIALLLPSAAEAHAHRHHHHRHHHAHRHHHHRHYHYEVNPLVAAAKRAVIYWHANPCDGRVSVVGEVASDNPLPIVKERAPYMDAWTTWDSPTGETSQLSPPSTFTDCVVHLNLQYLRSWRADDETFDDFCQVVVHEYGHLLGHPDAGAPEGTVESARAEEAPIVRPCQHYRLRYGHIVFAPANEVVNGEYRIH